MSPRLGIAVLALAVALSPAAAETRLDDSASPRQRLDLRSRWQYDEEGRGIDGVNAMVAEAANVEVRLNTAAYVGKRGRIYIVLPDLVPGLRSPGGMSVEWKARGTFLSGRVLPGGRALLYDGTITGPLMGDILDFSIFLDARRVEETLRFSPEFDIDVAR
jgi:hypothetical protein